MVAGAGLSLDHDDRAVLVARGQIQPQPARRPNRPGASPEAARSPVTASRRVLARAACPGALREQARVSRVPAVKIGFAGPDSLAGLR